MSINIGGLKNLPFNLNVIKSLFLHRLDDNDGYFSHPILDAGSSYADCLQANEQC